MSINQKSREAEKQTKEGENTRVNLQHKLELIDLLKTRYLIGKGVVGLTRGGDFELIFYRYGKFQVFTSSSFAMKAWNKVRKASKLMEHSIKVNNWKRPAQCS